jgi:hypothetical protein
VARGSELECLWGEEGQLLRLSALRVKPGSTLGEIGMAIARWTRGEMMELERSRLELQLHHTSCDWTGVKLGA